MFILLLKVSRYLIKLINTSFYKIIFGRLFKINPLKSYFSGNVILDSGFIEVSDGLRVKRNLLINVRNEIIIGDDCLFGENVKIYDHDHRFSNTKTLIKEQGFTTNRVVIGNNVWVGSDVIILKGSKIGDNVIIAAGSIVNGIVRNDCLFLQKRSSTVVLIQNKLI